MLPLKSANSGRNSGALLLEASLSLLPIMVVGCSWRLLSEVEKGLCCEMCVAERGLGGEVGVEEKVVFM